MLVERYRINATSCSPRFLPRGLVDSQLDPRHKDRHVELQVKALLAATSRECEQCCAEDHSLEQEHRATQMIDTGSIHGGRSVGEQETVGLRGRLQNSGCLLPYRTLTFQRGYLMGWDGGGRHSIVVESESKEIEP
jgi:hypothetical protein